MFQKKIKSKLNSVQIKNDSLTLHPLEYSSFSIKKSEVFALFFEDATHLRSKYLHITGFYKLSGTLKNQTVQQEFQISVLDKKRCY